MEAMGEFDALLPSEKETVKQAALAFKYAIKLRELLRGMSLVLLVADVCFLSFYIIYFVVIQDGYWFNYIQLFHFLMDLALLLVVFTNGSIHTTLKQLIVVAAVAFFFDLFGSAYLRPQQYEDVTSLDPHKKNIKEILFVYQFFFIATSFLSIVLAVVFSFGVGLEGEVLIRYNDLPGAMDEFSEPAMILYLTRLAEVQIAQKMADDSKAVQIQAARTEALMKLAATEQGYRYQQQQYGYRAPPTPQTQAAQLESGSSNHQREKPSRTKRN